MFFAWRPVWSVKFRSRTTNHWAKSHHCARFLEANEVTLKWWQSACNKHWKVAMAGMNMLTAPCHRAVRHDIGSKFEDGPKILWLCINLP
jgi:hypothetical protein